MDKSTWGLYIFSSGTYLSVKNVGLAVLNGSYLVEEIILKKWKNNIILTIYVVSLSIICVLEYQIISYCVKDLV